MAGDLHIVPMRLVDRGGELGGRDVHIGLGRGEAERGPVADQRARILRVAQRVELGNRRRGPLEIGRREVEIGPDHAPRLDLPPDAEVAIRIRRSTRPRGGDAAGEIELREGDEHLVGDERAVDRRRAEHMFVHPDEPRDHRLAAAVDRARALGQADRAVGADGRDPVMIDEQRLVRARHGAGAVDHGHMLDRDQRPALAHEIRLLRRLGTARKGAQETDEKRKNLADHRRAPWLASTRSRRRGD